MKIVLTAIEPSLCKSWTEFCGDLDFVTVHEGSIFEVECEAVVSPANSFGFMDGGIDALYMRYFGREIENRVRRQIYEHHHGEMIVGTADVVETNHPKLPFLIIAPTMRVPTILRDTVNPYLAARAILLLVRNGFFLSGNHKGEKIGNRIGTIAMPGLGTGVGRVGFNTCARQVRQAIDDVMLENYTMPRSWAEASERHQLLYTDRLKRLQHE